MTQTSRRYGTARKIRAPQGEAAEGRLLRLYSVAFDGFFVIGLGELAREGAQGQDRQGRANADRLAAALAGLLRTFSRSFDGLLTDDRLPSNFSN